MKALNKLARQLESQQVKLQFWPLTGPSRVVGFPDASYRNNEDGSSQRGMAVFLAESRERSSKDGMSYGSPIDNESPKIKKIVLSTTVAKTVFLYEMFWFMPVSPWIMDGHFRCSVTIHMRTDAKKMVTTARTIHSPETKGDNPHDFHFAKGSLFGKYS